MKLKEQSSTELYLSEEGYLVIKQFDGSYDQSIYLSPDQALQVKRYIEDNMPEQAELWEKEPEEENKK